MCHQQARTEIILWVILFGLGEKTGQRHDYYFRVFLLHHDQMYRPFQEVCSATHRSQNALLKQEVPCDVIIPVFTHLVA